jgi:hypothetical protein
MTYQFNKHYIPILTLRIENFNKTKVNVIQLEYEITDTNECAIVHSALHGECAVKKVSVKFNCLEITQRISKMIQTLIHENSTYDGDDLCYNTFQKNQYGISLKRYLQFVYADDHDFGFSNNDGHISTAESALFNYFGQVILHKDYSNEINQVLVWMSSYAPESDYEQSLKNIYYKEYIWYDDAILLAGIFATYKRYLQNKESRKNKKFLGTVGKSYETLLKLSFERTYRTDYGRYYIYTFEDKSGNLVKWNTVAIIRPELVLGFRMCRMKVYAHLKNPYKQTEVKFLKLLS